MAQPIIEKIEKTSRVDSAHLNEQIIDNDIPRLRETFSYISPKTPSEMFFNRQTVIGKDTEGTSRWNVLGRFTWYLDGVYFTRRKSGELIVAHLENHIAWLRRAWAQTNPFQRFRELWRVDDETLVLISKARTAYMTHDYQTAEISLLQIQLNVREMLEIIEREKSVYSTVKK